MKERTAIANALAEDNEIFALIEKAALVGPNQIIGAGVPLTRSDFVDLYVLLTSRQLAPGCYLMHPLRLGDLMRWKPDELDQVSLNILIESGQYGVLHGVRLLASTRVPPTRVYCTTTPDKLGRLPKRRSLGLPEEIPGCKIRLMLENSVILIHLRVTVISYEQSAGGYFSCN